MLTRFIGKLLARRRASASSSLASAALSCPWVSEPIKFQPMNVVWIVGWGINPEVLRPRALALSPAANVALHRPTPDALPSAATAELVIAWSYGAFLMLEAASRGRVFSGQVRLFAPFLAFCAEDGQGGKFQRSQVLWLQRWLRKNPAAALADFALRAGLAPADLLQTYEVEELAAGLERMINGIPAASRTTLNQGLPSGWTAQIGADDRLLDAASVARSLPNTQIIPNAGHALSELLLDSHAF